MEKVPWYENQKMRATVKRIVFALAAGVFIFGAVNPDKQSATVITRVALAIVAVGLIL